jgi:hypothetical protein
MNPRSAYPKNHFATEKTSLSLIVLGLSVGQKREEGNNHPLIFAQIIHLILRI